MLQLVSETSFLFHSVNLIPALTLLFLLPSFLLLLLHLHFLLVLVRLFLLFFSFLPLFFQFMEQ